MASLRFFGQSCRKPLHISAPAPRSCLDTRLLVSRYKYVSHGLNNADSAGVHARLLHTSRFLSARASFAKRVQDKIQKIRQDPAIQQKVMGVGAVGYTVAKFSKIGAVMKFALPALKLTKAMPLMSMGLTTILYSCFFGLPFAAGIVGTLFASNAARASVLHRYGCEVPPQMMIPFFGTMSSGSENTDHRKTEEYILQNKPFQRCLVTLSPVAGMFLFTSTVPFGLGGLAMGSQCGWAVANTGFMMGMFSLLPLGQMTPGGQLLKYFSKNALLLGTGFNFALLFVLPNPILYLCFFANLYSLYQRGFTVFGRQFGGGEETTYEQVSHELTLNVFTDKQKAIIGSLYWALFIMNAGGLALVNKSLLTPQMLRQQQAAEEQEHRQHLDPEALAQYDSRVPDSGGFGFGVSDWAMQTLNTVEEMDSNEEQSLDWWDKAQLEADRNIPAHERFRQ